MNDYPEIVDEPEAAPDGPREERTEPGRGDARPYLDFLASEGYRPEVDEEGDIRFRHEGRTLFLIPYERDPGYFCVAYPGVRECESPEEEARALEAANRVNRDLKAAKCVLHDGVVWITVEQFFDPPEGYRAVLSRLLDVIGAAAWQFRERMRESA